MRRLISALIALIAAFVIGLPALAQTPVATPAASPIPDTFTGLVDGVTRLYVPDPQMVPSDDPEAFVLVSVHLFRFDIEEHAEETWALLADHAPALIGTQEGVEATPELDEESVDDIGDHARVISFSATNPEGDTGYYRTIHVQDGEYLIIATAMGGSAENVRLADELARAVTEREAGDGSTSFSADGTSTGGIWNKLPATGGADAQELTAFDDEEIAVP